jgi:hypothetical protein
MVNIGFMRKQEIQSIVFAARETAYSIVGARAWETTEDATAMYDVIFWSILAKQLPKTNIDDLLSVLDQVELADRVT